jgi:hypothetical protein
MAECTCDSCLPGLLTKRYKARATKRKLDKMAATALAGYAGLRPGFSSAEFESARAYGIGKYGDPISKAVRTPAGPSRAALQVLAVGTPAAKPGKPVTKARKPADEYAAFLRLAGAPPLVRFAAGTQPTNRSAESDPEFERYLRQIGRVLI